MDNSKNELPHIPTTQNNKNLEDGKNQMQKTTPAQKFALRRNQHLLEEIYNMYWKHENYLHGNEMKKRFLFTTKEICEKYEIESIHVLIFILQQHKKEYAGTCIFCKEDYFDYEIRSGDRSTYCGCKGICKECKKPYSCASSKYEQTCSNCSYRKENQAQRIEENQNSDLLFIAFHANAQQLMMHYYDSQVSNIVDSMKKRLKFLQSYLKLSGLE